MRSQHSRVSRSVISRLKGALYNPWLLSLGVLGWGCTIGIQIVQPSLKMGESEAYRRFSPAPTSTDVQRWKVVRAFMRSIFAAEGTWYEGTKLDPYRTEVFTYNQIGNFTDHPHQYGTNSTLPCAFINGKWTCSGAVGAAQWLPDTWNRVRSQARFWFEGEQFSPQNQDMAMLYELERVGSLNALFNGMAIKQGNASINRKNFDIALSKAAPVWASLPRWNGDDDGAHEQGARSSDKLWKIFNTELGKENKSW